MAGWCLEHQPARMESPCLTEVSVHQSNTADPIRQLIEEWDAAHEPKGEPLYPDSVAWDEYLSDRDRFVRGLEAETSGPDGSDLEWLEEQARYYRSVGSDVARLAADALAGIAARMDALGIWDAASLEAVERDRAADLAAA